MGIIAGWKNTRSSRWAPSFRSYCYALPDITHLELPGTLQAPNVAYCNIMRPPRAQHAPQRPRSDFRRIMARENMEEWGTVATIEHETVRAVIDAYADGKIELPAIGAKTRGSAICDAPSVVADDRPGKAHHAYTRLSVALFLGWTKKAGDRLKPNYACTQSFAALELIERKMMKESDFRGQF